MGGLERMISWKLPSWTGFLDRVALRVVAVGDRSGGSSLPPAALTSASALFEIQS